MMDWDENILELFFQWRIYALRLVRLELMLSYR